ncbi:hypothetical protein HDU98_001878 [Podochytrium sp. JEL0797]|nr:hypothetical protein HDU98_001878 [Podochytrium sp. JEL0797]
MSDFTSQLTALLALQPLDARKLGQHVDAVLDPSLGLVVSRAQLGDFVTRVAALTAAALASSSAQREATLDALEAAWRHTLAATKERQVAFEDAVQTARLALADLLEDQERWTDAANVLTQLNLDHGHRHVDALLKVRVYVRIVRLLLEDEDDTSAEAYLNRASLVVNTEDFDNIHTQEKQMLLLQFKACQARLLDFKRNFQLAAQKYHQLSFVFEMDESERIVCLVQAVTCALLAPAGPARSRLLATLYKDDRVRENPELSTVFFPILEKMYLDRILRASEVDGFRQTLKPHQLALLTTTTTVLDRAVTEHNILAASKIYTSITFLELASLLGVKDAHAAESIVSKMIGEGRVEGKLDQIDGMVYFYEGREGVDGMSVGIRGLCEQVEEVVEVVVKRNAGWVDGLMMSA